MKLNNHSIQRSSDCTLDRCYLLKIKSKKNFKKNDNNIKMAENSNKQCCITALSIRVLQIRIEK